MDADSDADDIVAKFGGNRRDLRFRITYSGELKAAGKRSRAPEKDAVRRYISPQLAELHLTHPIFGAYGLMLFQAPKIPAGRRSPLDVMGDEAAEQFGRAVPIDVTPGHYNVGAALTECMEVRGRKYIPLVRASTATTCGLDILFLRKGGAGTLIAEGGDLDNRIKVLFDGLRVPKSNEVEPTAPGGGDDITYCLLEDDALITEFAVRSDRLLTHPGASDSQVLLVIDVVVRVSHLTSNNLGFLSE